MSYSIDERNPERQQLLAAVLNPPTRDVLARLPSMPGAHCLDLGCGQGNTTRCLADVLQPASCVGLEYDPALEAESRDMVAGLAALEADPHGVLVKFTDMWVIAQH